jgi:hypothetical protein
MRSTRAHRAIRGWGSPRLDPFAEICGAYATAAGAGTLLGAADSVDFNKTTSSSMGYDSLEDELIAPSSVSVDELEAMVTHHSPDRGEVLGTGWASTE